MRTELVTTLKRHATRILADLKRDGSAVLITEHGLPSAYLVNVDRYEHMQQRLDLLEGIARGERALAEGRCLDHAAVRERLARWFD